MSTKQANKLIGRIKRTTSTSDGTRFSAVLSDAARMYMVGDISAKEMKEVQRAGRQQLRRFDGELKHAALEFRKNTLGR